jgi:hypothetical protein
VSVFDLCLLFDFSYIVFKIINYILEPLLIIFQIVKHTIFVHTLATRSLISVRRNGKKFILPSHIIGTQEGNKKGERNAFFVCEIIPSKYNQRLTVEVQVEEDLDHQWTGNQKRSRGKAMARLAMQISTVPPISGMCSGIAKRLKLDNTARKIAVFR